MPHLGMPQAAAGSAHTCGVQALPGHRLLFFLASSGFPPFPWSTAPWSSEQRTPPCATATVFRRPLPSFFLPPCFFCQVCRQLAAANVLAILGECACFCSGGAFSHISPPPCASIGLELATCIFSDRFQWNLLIIFEPFIRFNARCLKTRLISSDQRSGIEKCAKCFRIYIF